MPDNGEAPKPNPDRPHPSLEKITSKNFQTPKPDHGQYIQRAIDALNRKASDVSDSAIFKKISDGQGQGVNANSDVENYNSGSGLQEDRDEKHGNDILTPEKATENLFREMDELELKKELGLEKSVFVERITHLLRIASRTEDPQSYKIFREDSHFQKLKIGSKYLIRNSFDRDLHRRVFAYLGSVGINTSDAEMREIESFFEKRDLEKKRGVLESYAQNGLLTLKSALEKVAVKETSSTPGDSASLEDLEWVKGDQLGNLRGYELSVGGVNDALFYGRNSFFGVVLERGGESIDRAGEIPKIEVENRLRNSMLFVVRSDRVEMSRRAQNVGKEDVIGRDIKPDEIDSVIVANSNLALAQEVFGHLPTTIVGVDFTSAEIHNLYDGPYKVPNYRDAVEQIAKDKGPVWCHIARLPLDTYPTSNPEE